MKASRTTTPTTTVTTTTQTTSASSRRITHIGIDIESLLYAVCQDRFRQYLVVCGLLWWLLAETRRANTHITFTVRPSFDQFIISKQARDFPVRVVQTVTDTSFPVYILYLQTAQRLHRVIVAQTLQKSHTHTSSSSPIHTITL